VLSYRKMPIAVLSEESAINLAIAYQGFGENVKEGLKECGKGIGDGIESGLTRVAVAAVVVALIYKCPWVR
jgi:ABC-type proline/glycine betaine transport system permease subunit